MPTDFERVLIVSTDGNHLRRICKVLPLADGGFAITAPYHSARQGTVMRFPWSAAVGTWSVAADLTFPFDASDRVKLSCHWDGFSQFSGENSKKIISGRAADGSPKGVGLMAQPLSRPLVTGPTAACSVWGLEDFDAYVPRKGEAALVFEEQADFYVDERVSPRVTLGEGNGISISFLTFPATFFPKGASSGSKFTIVPKEDFAPAKEFKAQIIRVSPMLTLAVIAHPVSMRFQSQSGFQLSGPSDLSYAILAQYPPLFEAGSGRSLDYSPEGDGVAPSTR